MKNENFDEDALKKIIRNLDDYLWNITNYAICSICHELVNNPVTTSCKHSFCSKCLKRSLNGTSNNSCPLCRHPLKRRGSNENHLLMEIAALCHELPKAFEEDVLSLNPKSKAFAEELINSSRITDIASEKHKGNAGKHKKGPNKRQRKNLSVDFPFKASEETDSESVHVDKNKVIKQYGKRKSANDSTFELKSISQVESGTQGFIPDSPDIERKLRKVAKVAAKKKVGDWLEGIENGVDVSKEGSSFLKGDAGPERVEPTAKNSMIRIDYNKKRESSKKRQNPEEKLVDDDPYEFISSQKVTRKRGRKGSKTRKRSFPMFEAIQHFEKPTAKKRKMAKEENEADAGIVGDKTDGTVDGAQVVDKVEELQIGLRRRPCRVLSERGEEDSEGDIADAQEKSTLGAMPNSNIDSDESCETASKNPNLGVAETRNVTPEKSKGTSPGKGRKGGRKSAKVIAGTSHSPGWSRVSSLKMDFEMASKKKRPSRRSLNISRGKLTVNETKDKEGEEPLPEDGELDHSHNDSMNSSVYIEDMSQNSEVLVGFSSQSSNDGEKEFKEVVEKMEKEMEKVVEEMEVEPEKLDDNQVSSPEKEERKISEKAVEEKMDVSPGEADKRVVPVLPPPAYPTTKVSSCSVIPFTLLGKIKKKKKRSSISFLQLGRLSPRSKRRSAVVKIIFPKSRPWGGGKNLKPTTATVAVQTSPEKEGREMRVDAETQTTQSCFHYAEKGIQAAEEVVRVSTGIQTNLIVEEEKVESLPRQLFDSRDTGEAIDKMEEVKADSVLDMELLNELEKSWGESRRTQKRVATKQEEEEKENEDLLMERAIENLKSDMQRISKVPGKSPAKHGGTCEESDSDIFIEQTPPRVTRENQADVDRKEEDEENESCLIISQVDTSIVETRSDRKNPTLEEVARVRTEFTTPKGCRIAKDVAMKENDPNLLNSKGKTSERKSRRDRICIMSSRVKNPKNIDRFVNTFKVEYLTNPRKDLTHLVVGLYDNEDDESLPNCTPKLLYAMANKKWVVSEAWIEACLNANAIVPEAPFESVDPKGGNGCSAARLSDGYLLEECEVYLLGEYERITKEEFSELIRDCGGKVISRPEDFSHSPKKIRMILVDSCDRDPLFNVLMKKYRTAVMFRDVIIVSILGYKLINFTPFLAADVDVKDLLKWGYPLEFVREEENERDSEEEDSESESG